MCAISFQENEIIRKTKSLTGVTVPEYKMRKEFDGVYLNPPRITYKLPTCYVDAIEAYRSILDMYICKCSVSAQACDVQNLP